MTTAPGPATEASTCGDKDWRATPTDPAALAKIAAITQKALDLYRPINECGEHAARRENPEFYADLDDLFGAVPSGEEHYPAGYAPGCDGCAAAQTADRERRAIGQEVLALLGVSAQEAACQVCPAITPRGGPEDAPSAIVGSQSGETR